MQILDHNYRRMPLKIRELLGHLLTTKGDTIVGGTSGVVVEPVAANGTILSADSTEASGRKWIPVAAPLAHAASHNPGGADAVSYQAALVSQSVQGTAFNAYTTAKTVIPASSLYTIPANTLSVGKSFRVSVLGSFSNIAVTPGTTTFQVMLVPTHV